MASIRALIPTMLMAGADPCLRRYFLYRLRQHPKHPYRHTVRLRPEADLFPFRMGALVPACPAVFLVFLVRHLIFRNQMTAAVHRRLYIVAAAKPVLRVHPHRLGRGEERMVFFCCGCGQRTY